MNNMKSIYLMRTLSIIAMLLSFVVTADAQRVSKRFPEITFWDYTFRGKADSVDCIYNKKLGLYFTGFDTDGKGTFCFAGGSPLRVSCFKGNRLQWRREVADERTRCSLFRMRDDNVYLVHDMKRELIVVSKDGGSVRHIKLPVDTIMGGCMHDKYFVLRNNEVKYNGVRFNYELSFFNYEGALLWKDTVDICMVEQCMRPAPDYYDNRIHDGFGGKILDPNYSYKGMFYGSALFERFWEFRLNVKGTKDMPTIKKYDFDFSEDMYEGKDVNGVSFFDLEDDDCHFGFWEENIYRGTHLYEVASQWDSGILTVIDFDIEKMFPEYMRHYKRWAKYIGDKEIEDLEKVVP